MRRIQAGTGMRPPQARVDEIRPPEKRKPGWEAMRNMPSRFCRIEAEPFAHPRKADAHRGQTRAPGRIGDRDMKSPRRRLDPARGDSGSGPAVRGSGSASRATVCLDRDRLHAQRGGETSAKASSGHRNSVGGFIPFPRAERGWPRRTGLGGGRERGFWQSLNVSCVDLS